MAKPAALVDHVSLRVFVSGHGHVLLVAACSPQPTFVGCIRGTVRHWHHSECHLSLSRVRIVISQHEKDKLEVENARNAWRCCKCWARRDDLAVILFLVMAALAFIQRAVTGT